MTDDMSISAWAKEMLWPLFTSKITWMFLGLLALKKADDEFVPWFIVFMPGVIVIVGALVILADLVLRIMEMNANKGR